jgi:TonB family protein
MKIILRTLTTAILLTGTILVAQDVPENPEDKTQHLHTSHRILELLSDTKGVNFGPYLEEVVHAIQQNWRTLTMDSSRHNLTASVEVIVEFSIQRDGTVSGARVVGPSGDAALDQAALDAIAKSSPFSALPESFPDQYFDLRFHLHWRSGFDMSGNCRSSNNGSPDSPNPGLTSDCSEDRKEGVHRIARGMSAPKKISGPEPEFTNKARRAKLQGTVTLKVIVTAEGTTRDITVEKSLDPGLDQKAIDAVSKWKFEPAMKDGQPVAVQIYVQVDFKLY